MRGTRRKCWPNYGKQILPGIVSHAPTRNAILRMRWATRGIAQEFPDLLLSDRPVYRSHGIVDDRCVIAVPLSPWLLFVATREQETRDKVMATPPRVLAMRLNALLVAQAEKNVYAAHDGHLPLVRKHLRHEHDIEVKEHPGGRMSATAEAAR